MDACDLLLGRLIDALSLAPAVPLVYAESAITADLGMVTPVRPLVELVSVRSGSIQLTVGDRQTTLRRGDLALINAHFGNFATFADAAATRCMCLSFDVSAFPGLLSVAAEPVVHVRAGGDARDWLERHERIAATARLADSPRRRWQLKGEVLALLAGLLSDGPGTAGPEPTARLVREALILLDRRHGAPLRISALARALGVTASHLSREFRRRLGVSPTEHLLQLRLRRAAGLLARTDASIKQIASQVGFADPLYFSRRFTAFAGSSPTVYRRRQRAGGGPGPGDPT